MLKNIKPFSLILIAFYSFSVASIELDNKVAPAFELIVLGDSGGSQDGNLSAFLLRALTDSKYIGLDAGTLLNGIEKSVQQNAFNDLDIDETQKTTSNINILHNHIAAYMISHGHLDHISGLLVASPDDQPKPIYALPSVNQAISNSYFNWQAWPNFSNRGKMPRLNKYKMIDLPLIQTIDIPNTSLSIKAFSLSHPVKSTAFVIENDKNMMVYFGDTGPDELEKQNKIKQVWQYLTKQVKHKKLRGIVIEASFPDSHPDKFLYGHLTPKWLTQELTHLSSLLAEPTLLPKTKIIISHVKRSILKDVDASDVIKKELQQHNKLGLHFIMAKQGAKILL
jgi:3',5'-cyclic-nucleotide phosphodiesterase